MFLHEYIQHDATSLAQLVKQKAVSPHELLDCALQQLEKTNPQINAVIRLFTDKARTQIDEVMANNADAPFAGVPFLLKDLLASYAGEPMGSGVQFLQNYVPPQDSELVRRYKKAGLIAFGKTSLPELGLAPYTESRVHGVTRNPYNLNHSAGGSSGGSSAAVAARIVPVAGAGDGGGSIRIPASLNGLVGLKPSRGRVPSGPASPDPWWGMVAEHVVTRSVRDCAAFLDISHGDYAAQLLKANTYAGNYAHAMLQTPQALRIAYSATGILGGVLDDDNKAALDTTVKMLRDMGHHLEEVTWNIDGDEFLYQYVILLCAEVAAELKRCEILMGKVIRYGEVEPRTWSMALMGRSFKGEQVAYAYGYMQNFARAWLSRFNAYDVTLTSTMAQTPALIGQHSKLPMEDLQHFLTRIFPPLIALGKSKKMILKTFASVLDYMPQTPIANVTGEPSISLPMYVNAAGLPIGVMATARVGDEVTLLKLAHQLELCVQWQKRMPDLAR